MGIVRCGTAALAAAVFAGALAFGMHASAEDAVPLADAVKAVPLADAAKAVPPADAAKAAPPEIEPAVVEELRRAAVLLTGAPKISLRAETGYDAVQRNGQKIEFGSTRRILLRRPDHFLVEAEQRDGSHKRMSFDGRTLSFFDVGQQAYAEAPKTGDIDAAIDYLVGELATPVPLSDLFRSDLAERVTNGLVAARFAGEETLFGVPCEHLSLRKPSVDIQLWIERGERPLIRRIVITYRDAPGEPQFWANLSDWSFTPDVSDARFAFRPPKGAEKIPFAPRATIPAPTAKATTGEQQ
jgi:hypothetical protein